MGIAPGDYLNNGMVDLFNTTFSDDYDPLYRNDGDANFTDISYQLGIAEATVPFLGWGAAFFDFDLLIFGAVLSVFIQTLNH